MNFKSVAITVFLVATSGGTSLRGQSIIAMRDDQLNRLTDYLKDVIQPSGLVRDSLLLNPLDTQFHPASPGGAGHVLVGICALHRAGKLTTAIAEQYVTNILNAYTGHTIGVTPARSADGFFAHYLDLQHGTKAANWPVEYSTIDSALLTRGGEFAAKYFSNNQQIVGLAHELEQTIHFNAAINPNTQDGSMYRLMLEQGGGDNSAITRPWNEYMLVESLALRQPQNQRAVAVKRFWFNVALLPKSTYQGIPTLTDIPGTFAPAFEVQQGHYLNGDFRLNPNFENFFQLQREADRLYSTSPSGLNQSFRYGLTAGVSKFVSGNYHRDAIFQDPGRVFTPEAVAGWNDMDTLLQFFQAQPPSSDSRFRYGLVRVSADDPTWIPSDAGLVDHLFLLFGLVESTIQTSLSRNSRRHLLLGTTTVTELLMPLTTWSGDARWVRLRT